jgi:hypothetical protein
MDPEDTLAALGLTTDEAAPGQGYQQPVTDPTLPTEMAQPGTAAPEGQQRNGALEQARVLATLGGQGKTSGLDRFAAGAGAKLGKAPSHPLAAALDGGLSGFAAAYGAGKGKGGLSDIKERMGLLKTLFDMDRSLARDKSANEFRERSLDATNRRTDAYVERAGRPGGGRAATDPLLREGRITSILKNHPAQKALDDGIDPNTNRRLTPEARTALKAQVDAERKRLEALGGVPIGEGIVPPPATPSPQPKGPQVDSGAPNVNVVPNPTVDVAPAPAPSPKVTAQPAPKQPTISREQIIEQGRAANQNGAPLEAIIGRAKQSGFELTPDDFNPPQQSQGGSFNPLSIIQSLFGG